MGDAGNILVCVTRQKNCDRLIRYGATFQEADNTLYVLHMVYRNEKFLHASDEGLALEYLFDISKTYGADLNLIKTQNLEQSLADFIAEHHIGKVIFGKTNNQNAERKNHKLAQYLVDDERIEILII